MSILRNLNRERFTVIDNELLEDATLSWDAKGLLTFLLSKPDGWEINQTHIERSGTAGKYKVRKMFKELYDAGYLEQRQHRAPDGVFIGSEVVLVERPMAKNRNAEKPECPKNGDSVNQPQVNTDYLVNTDSSKSIGRPSRFEDFWQTYPKKAKKKPAREIWQRKQLDSRADLLIADVQNRQQNDRRWLEGFIPDPTTYLNQERWDDEIEPPKEFSREKSTRPPTYDEVQRKLRERRAKLQAEYREIEEAERRQSDPSVVASM